MLQAEERYRALVENTLDLIAIVSVDGTIDYVSPSVTDILGYRPEDLIGTSSFALYHPDDAGRMLALLNDALNEPGTTAPIDIRMLHANDSWTHVEIRAINLQDVPSVGGVVLVARDITERKTFEEQLERRALYDAVTTLPNRTLFMDYLEHALARADRRLESVIVMFLDLDNFKMVNDTFGHAFGDLLLVRVAERLRACLRSSDTAARFGGDEFTLLLEDINTSKDAVLVAERVIRELSAPFFIDGREVFTTVSVGIAYSAPGESRPGDLLRDADIALYRAKAEGKSRWVIFTEEMSGTRPPTGQPRPGAVSTAIPEAPDRPRVDSPAMAAALPEEVEPSAPEPEPERLDEHTLRTLLSRISALEREAGRLEAEIAAARQRRGEENG
jgi:diguanylate cyclase (GGDEF)-like protein/PAS domain S-box-containing protein